MKKLFENWKSIAYNYMVCDDLISFYTFFTIIFAECAYLWAFETKFVAINLTIVFIAYIANILVFAWLKGWYEGEKGELIVARLYIVGFVTIFIVGCFISFWCNLLLTTIAFGVTYLWVKIRNFQDTQYMEFRGVVGAVSKLFNNAVFWVISQIIVIGVPFVAFVCMLTLVSELSITLKILIPIVYFIAAPFISLLEDEMVAQNIFEIAYDIFYNDKFESKMRELVDKHMLDSLKKR